MRPARVAALARSGLPEAAVAVVTRSPETSGSDEYVAATRQELEAKLERLKADYLSLSRWAGQQNAGNAFATQVRMYADARIMEWDLPLEEWEP